MNHHSLRTLLCQLGNAIRDAVIAGRSASTVDQLCQVAHESTADTIYAIDKISEEAITQWFVKNWPADQPVELVLEGVEDDAPLCFPIGTHPADTKWKCIIDPIDGTRGIMYDKRSAWALAGIAPQLGPTTALSDIVAAAMTEIPTSKQWRADQLSAARGDGVVAEAVNVLDQSRSPLDIQPSKATDFRHGFASLAKFFPEGRTLISQIEEQAWDDIVGLGSTTSPTIFDDQYISTGGQFYELLMGHDRFIGDIRPIVYACLDLESSLVCHPYDLATALLLTEAGITYETPFGDFPDSPLDTTSGVSWLAFANDELAAIARPVFTKAIARMVR
ncbi:MAG: hypothetical protein WA771_11985 [Chthoniobacterales bacterium]